MPNYNYLCLDCEAKAVAKKGSELTVEEFGDVIFETCHKMNPAAKELAEARTCPRCHGKNTEKTSMEVATIFFVRGRGFEDKKGLNRDMNAYKLKKDDPYGEYRVPGEVADIEARLKKEGQKDYKKTTFA